MKRFLILYCLFTPFVLYSQSNLKTAEIKQSLQERFQGMKSNSQTFKEYKVINEMMLDKEWRIISDSVMSIRNQWHEARSNGIRLEGELKSVQVALQQKEASTAKIEHAASHIDFFGIDFNKTAFVGMVMVVIAGLLVLLGLLMGRLKIMFREIKEKNETIERITHELEDYKHKMLDKQSKLSRELQNERNKLQEMRRA